VTPHLLLIDNYDSFTYNWWQAFLVLGAQVSVYRNDALTPQQAQALAPSHLCISPGPGTPYDAGVSMDMIRAFAGRIPVLGVCLGHQAIVEVFGARCAGRSPHARQDFARTSRSAHAVRGSAAAVRGGALPFADRRSRDDAAGARGECADRGREIMAVRPPFLVVEGVQFSSREHPDARRSTAAGQFSSRTPPVSALGKPRPEQAMALRVSCCNSCSSAATCRRRRPRSCSLT